MNWYHYNSSACNICCCYNYKDRSNSTTEVGFHRRAAREIRKDFGGGLSFTSSIYR